MRAQGSELRGLGSGGWAQGAGRKGRNLSQLCLCRIRANGWQDLHPAKRVQDGALDTDSDRRRREGGDDRLAFDIKRL